VAHSPICVCTPCLEARYRRAKPLIKLAIAETALALGVTFPALLEIPGNIRAELIALGRKENLTIGERNKALQAIWARTPS